MKENINSVKSAESFLKEQNVDIDKYVEKGINEISNKHIKSSCYCNFCKGLGFDPYLDLEGVRVLCPECSKRSTQ